MVSAQDRLLHKRRLRRDRVASRVITVGGLTVLVTLGLLIWHLLYVTTPLLFTPSLSFVKQWSVPDNNSVMLMEDLQLGRAMLFADDNCRLSLYQKEEKGSALQALKTLPLDCQGSFKTLYFDGGRYLFQLSKEGLVRVERLSRNGDQFYKEQLASFYAVSAEESRPALDWQVSLSGDWVVVAIKYAQGWNLVWVSRENPLDIRRQSINHQGDVVLLPALQTALFSQGKELLFVGKTYRHSLTLADDVSRILAFPGDKAVLVGHQNGMVEKWSVQNQDGHFVYHPIYHLNQKFQLKALQSAQGNDLGVVLGEQGELLLFLGTTGEILRSSKVGIDSQDIWLTENRLYVWNDKLIQQWNVDNASSIVSFDSLWKPVWYEGYPSADYVWQSTAAEDLSQAKYSLVPLFIGSFKAAIFALCIAIPVAVGGAVYTAYFMPQAVRNWVKPSIELLEAIPSVVIGFIAAIWLIPLVADHLVGIVLFVLLLPPTLVLAALLQQPIARALSLKWKSGWELLLLAPMLLLLIWLSSELGMVLTELWWPQGFPFEDDAHYSSKNALVVSLALGLAIAPSIYALAEDAIFEVPAHLSQASFALGATRTQTLRRVVLVAAYPGIFSSIMLGLSRAFGETMIVLMITGNTPVADWDIFAGMRTLTANIAIELPESEVSSIHYRVLFLTALLLFAFTFFINTLAELIRGRLRKHYQSV
ncbi:ABC transporter permease subunit [Aliiglaciecola sp. CAU 1673]|uniref:ABC transporter permease subunit n=1 Tax=Aliiglaciecola sp. CAU 1673 TaxID=3032595 RepID=UPI0023D99FBF|nr:ABC transporter permease subunit [Aliiglaciecola sp. CAU 1673]MDF2179426.1 ABC transporter permease subunit [Aliiglaciecola sp. CAU 1673]